MNSGPRWLISMTDMPLPCQSSISSAACCSTSLGSTAGPAEKLKIWVTGFPAPVCLLATCGLGDDGRHALLQHVLGHRVRFLGDLRDQRLHFRRDRALVEGHQLVDLGQREMPRIYGHDA